MQYFYIYIIAFCTPTALSWGQRCDVPGLIRKPSNYSAEETIDRLENVLESKNITIMARVVHHEGAASVGLDLRPTILLIFGNPKLGTPLMQEQQTIGIDLPMKAMAYEDEYGQTWLVYNEPVLFARRHNITQHVAIIKTMTGALYKLTEAALNN